MRPEADHPALDTADFCASILDPRHDEPAHVVGPRGKKAVRRFNVYRNNVTVSLINALADIFPAVRRIAGETLFRDMAREFVRAHPPVSPLLFLYGHEFPAFVETFEHTRRMPYLADVARLERAWLTAYHAADVEPLAPAVLGEIPPSALESVTFAPHPATGLVISEYAVFDIFDANRNHETVGRIDAARAQSALVTRPGHEVIVIALDDGHDAFFSCLIQGGALGEAAAAGLAKAGSFDVASAITGLLSTGAFAAVATQ
ncbi:DNA-binding domain-containing protein [Oricola thermophila]|uniref:Putative DNA-binding domain-containing protein n=1 Tax=Oricola thermophila TaxID=2742145 RepID=A0A6N1VLQ8_9HYPH|nr:DNA-binding domain-containing protein [Oricola thermophila]QKV20362.1 putative DNA-binding domain-containing protein [Oricola thermophila]